MHTKIDCMEVLLVHLTPQIKLKPEHVVSAVLKAAMLRMVLRMCKYKCEITYFCLTFLTYDNYDDNRNLDEFCACLCIRVYIMWKVRK